MLANGQLEIMRERSSILRQRSSASQLLHAGPGPTRDAVLTSAPVVVDPDDYDDEDSVPRGTDAEDDGIS